MEEREKKCRNRNWPSADRRQGKYGVRRRWSLKLGGVRSRGPASREKNEWLGPPRVLPRSTEYPKVYLTRLRGVNATTTESGGLFCPDSLNKQTEPRIRLRIPSGGPPWFLGSYSGGPALFTFLLYSVLWGLASSGHLFLLSPYPPSALPQNLSCLLPHPSPRQ
jgi:hypothetical protein